MSFLDFQTFAKVHPLKSQCCWGFSQGTSQTNLLCCRLFFCYLNSSSHLYTPLSVLHLEFLLFSHFLSQQGHQSIPQEVSFYSIVKLTYFISDNLKGVYSWSCSWTVLLEVGIKFECPFLLVWNLCCRFFLGLFRVASSIFWTLKY